MKFSHLILFFIFIICFESYSEQKKFKVHTIGFYNLENLFDTINDTSKRDEASPIMEMKFNMSLCRTLRAHILGELNKHF